MFIHSSGNAAPASATMTPIKRHDSPASRITKTAAAATSSEVPRSGWRAIRPTGRAINSAQPASARQLGGNSWRLSQAATIIGMAIFIISEG